MADPISRFQQWTLASSRRPSGGGAPEERTYEQGELSIEGEARLLGMARKIGALLKERNYDLDALGAMVNSGQPDWDLIQDTLALITEEVPGLIGESCCILLGIYPTNDDGTPNPEYEDHKKFLQASVNLSRFEQMLRVFVEQNDYQRLARPFWNRIRTQPPGPGPSPVPDSLVPSDSSTQDSA